MILQHIVFAAHCQWLDWQLLFADFDSASDRRLDVLYSHNCHSALGVVRGDEEGEPAPMLSVL